MKLKKGFTLIELLVVIAIIGILSTVVLASLTTARSKSQDAAVQQQLSSMRAQAELFYSSNGNNYGTPITGTDCTTGTLFTTGTGNLATLISGVTKTGSTVTCSASSTAWAVEATLPSNPSGPKFCVDSTGKSGTTTTALSTTIADCR